MSTINPTVLKWARESAGLSLLEAAKKLNLGKYSPDVLEKRLDAFEQGQKTPSRSLLSRMAKQYRRPLATFYMEKPPRKGDRGSDFRKLPDNYNEEDAALVDALIREVLLRQYLMRSALEDDDALGKLDFVGSRKTANGVVEVVKSISNRIDIDLATFRAQSNPEDAFKFLRDKVEQIGVFVLLIGDLGSYHTALDPKVFRGFALSDDVAPFIVINDRDSRAAWSFTLVHELTHIWLGQTGVSGTESDLEIEIFCNRVAGELLLPESDFGNLELENPSNFEQTRDAISNFALLNNVSSSMIAYRLFLSGKIDQRMWGRFDAEFRRLWIQAEEDRRKTNREKKGGPSYYVIRRHRLGKNFISQVHRLIIEGSLTTVKAAKILGVAPRNIQNLVESPSSKFK